MLATKRFRHFAGIQGDYLTESAANQPTPEEFIHPADCKPRLNANVFYGVVVGKIAGWSIVVMR